MKRFIYLSFSIVGTFLFVGFGKPSKPQNFDCTIFIATDGNIWNDRFPSIANRRDCRPQDDLDPSYNGLSCFPFGTLSSTLIRGYIDVYDANGKYWGFYDLSNTLRYGSCRFKIRLPPPPVFLQIRVDEPCRPCCKAAGYDTPARYTWGIDKEEKGAVIKDYAFLQSVTLHGGYNFPPKGGCNIVCFNTRTIGVHHKTSHS